MTNEEIRKWSREKLKGNLWKILPAILITSILTNLSYTYTYTNGNGSVSSTSFNFGWIFYFVGVGLCYFMVKFITDQQYEFRDIFHFSSDFVKCIGASLYQGIMIFLYLLLLIVPGIMKAYSYALVPYLMADEKYHDMKVADILKKSEEMMYGHRMDYFLLQLSFLGWHILSIFTLFILEIFYVGPYQTIAQTKFLNDLKVSLEKDGKAPVDEVKDAEVVTE